MSKGIRATWVMTMRIIWLAKVPRDYRLNSRLDGCFPSILPRRCRHCLWTIVGAVEGFFRGLLMLVNWLVMKDSAKRRGPPRSRSRVGMGAGRYLLGSLLEGSPPSRVTSRGKDEIYMDKICRGADALTLSCPFCEYVFPEGTSDEVLLKHRGDCHQKPADAPALSSMWKCPSCNGRIPRDKQQAHRGILSRFGNCEPDMQSVQCPFSIGGCENQT